MDRKINQKQFNELVLETMEDFDMEVQEAIEFAASQFVSQNVNLWNIVQIAAVVQGEDAITKFSVKYLPLLNEDIKTLSSDDQSVFQSELKDATQLLETSDPKTSMGLKEYAATMKVDQIVLEFARRHEDNHQILELCLKFLSLCYAGYPDLVSEETIDWLIHLSYSQGYITFCVGGHYWRPIILKMLVNCCLKHERNRQFIFARGAAKIIADCLRNNIQEEIILALQLITALCQDDDVRIEASSAHTHATGLAECLLNPCLSRFKDGHGSINQITALLNALTAMTVTNDLVGVIVNDLPDFIDKILYFLEMHQRTPFLLTALFKWLVSLSRNDDAKTMMKPLIPNIVRCMQVNGLRGVPPREHDCPFIRQAFLLVSGLTLRNKENASLFIEHGAIQKILSVMTNPPYEKCRKVGCLALRNMASSMKYNKPFEDTYVIETINELLSNDKSAQYIEDYKSVLVALNAPVELQCRWTGERGDIVGANN